ncbi:MAG: hypothetical protein KJ799_06475 [Bacteroidetes bacterium]|nr:hypothetical protein [Bacteroidota bacterium]
MLNEGYTLYKSLERCGIVDESSFTRGHRDVTNPGKSDGLIIGLDEKGYVTRIEFRNKQETIKLWTITKGNHNSFPAIKLQRPLWNIKSNDILRTHLKELKKNELEKKNLLFNQSAEFNITETEENWWQRLQERAKELQPLFETTDKNFNVFYELMTRFQLVGKFDKFLVGFLKALKDSKNDIPYYLIENILIGNKKDKNKDEYRAEVRLIFDVDDWDDANKFLNRVASPRLEPFIVSKMQNLSVDGNTPTGISSLSGNPKILIDDKYPQITLPIGKTYLFSASANIPCLERYGEISIKRLPVGKDEADDISRSLKGMTRPEKKGKTWYLIPSFKSGKKELLIVYLENKPDLKVNQAHLLGGESKDAFSETTYEAISSVAIEALEGEQIQKANSLIRMFILREADPGNKHISLQRVYTISQLEEADKRWREAAKNIPVISFPFFRNEIERGTAKRKDILTDVKLFLENKDVEAKKIFLSPICPFPTDLALLTQKKWFQPKKKDRKKQRDSTEVTRVSMDEVYDVFFAQKTEKKSVVEKLLTLTFQCTNELLIEIGHAQHKIELNKYKTELKFKTLSAISVIAIYLHKLEILKENYMRSSLFNVGRFLSLVDTVHFEWCKHVRGGYPKEQDEDKWRKSIPPQLLGNAHFRIALENPSIAFARLSERLNIYKAWTEKQKPAKGNWAHGAIAEIGKISLIIQDAIEEGKLPTATTEIDKTQILLGYLSRSEKKTGIDSKAVIEENLELNNSKTIIS